MAARVRVDERTKTMSVEALMCRTIGHAPTIIPTPTHERVELSRKGQRKIKTVCGNGCGRWRDVVIVKSSGEVVSMSGSYSDPKSYLVQQRGSGRLPRTEARKAFFAAVPDK